MDKTHREKGATRELKGTVNEVVGDMTGDRSQEMKGKVQKHAGRAQRELGEELDRDRDATRNTRH